MYMELESENIADPIAIFRHYIESTESVELTMSRKSNTYHIRVVRIDRPEIESPLICETNRESQCAERQHAA
jgi:hypothetical protein